MGKENKKTYRNRNGFEPGNNHYTNDEVEMVCDIETVVYQYTKPEKSTERGDSLLFDVQVQGKNENPEHEEIERLNGLLSEKDQEIINLKNKCKHLEEQANHLEKQFIIKQKEFSEKEITLEAEYKQKTEAFEACKAKEREALDAALQKRREEENSALEDMRRNNEAKLKEYYDTEYQNAQQKINDYLTQGMATAETKVQTWYEEALKDRASDYLKEKEDAWKDGHREFDNIRQDIAYSISVAKLEGCNEASRMQRELVEQMNSVMAQFGANMDKWRASMYSVEFEDFARWASKFFGFVDRFDRRIIDNIENGEMSPEMVRIGKNLISLRNQLDRAMTGMGLRCFYPQEGTKYDPVCHEVDTDEEISMDAEIQSCKNPGVEMGLADASNTIILSKAEVQIKE